MQILVLINLKQFLRFNSLNYKVKWIFNDNPEHFFIQYGDGNWSEFSSSNKPGGLEYTLLKYDDDDDSPIIFRHTSPKDRYLKLTDSLLISSFGSADNLATIISRSTFRGQWSAQLQSRNHIFYNLIYNRISHDFNN